ncbi:MAG TPA: IS200/IS605 family transposase [Ignavibacteriales bacterium]|nr:IS200/IS605 family transposase [Ignavibacteriales bacterium]
MDETSKTQGFRSDTFHQVYLHIVFAVKNREDMIRPDFSEELQKYMTGILQSKGNKMLAIKAMPDHVHMLISYLPRSSVSGIVRDVKSCSTEFIIRKGWSKDFKWQEGYGVFSYSRSHISQVISYIQNQEEHHRKRSFKEEYMKILKDFAVEYESKYLFRWIMEEEKT